MSDFEPSPEIIPGSQFPQPESKQLNPFEKWFMLSNKILTTFDLWVDKIPSWVPFFPEYARYQLTQQQAFNTLISGFNPKTGESLNVTQRIQEAAKIEAQALLHGGKSAIELILILGTSGSGSPAATKIADKLGQFSAEKGGEAAFLDTAVTALKQTATKIPPETARQSASTLVRLVETLATNTTTRAVMLLAIRNNPHWCQFQGSIRPAKEKLQQAQEIIKTHPQATKEFAFS